MYALLVHIKQNNLDKECGLSGARHFVELHFIYYDTSSNFFVELPVRRKVTSSNAFSSKTTFSRFFPRARRSKISHRRHAMLGVLIMCLSREIGNFSFKAVSTR